MTWSEINQALAYLQLNPPEKPANQRAAALMAQVANWSGKTMKEGASVSPDDYLGKPKPPEPRQSAEEQKAFLMGFTRKDNGS